MSSKVVTKSVKNNAVEKYKQMIKIAYIKQMAAELAAKNLAKQTKKNTKLAPVEEEEFDEDEYSRRLDEYFDKDYDY